MRVSNDLLSLGGIPLIELAEFEDQNGCGIRVTDDRDEVTLATDSYMPFGHVARLTPDDAEAIGYRLIESARKAREW